MSQVTMTLGEEANKTPLKKANKSAVVEEMLMQGVNETLLVMVKLLALGRVMMTLGEKTKKSSVVKEMVMQWVNMTLVMMAKQSDMAIVMMTLGEKVNLGRL